MNKKYHQAKFPATVKSCVDFLTQYKSNEHDATLEDPVSWCNQDDLFCASQERLSDFHPTNIIDIMIDVPVVCRTLCLKEPYFNCVNMNPWLGCVTHMPNIIKRVTTTDYITRFKNKTHDLDQEHINCAMLITTHPTGSILAKGVGKHMSSYLLSGNPDLYHPDADLATWGMVLVYLLLQPSMQIWMTEELDTIEQLNRCVYNDDTASWNMYVKLVASENYSHGLVTKSDLLPKWCQCPHLNKFILATFLLRNQLTADQMSQRRNAAVRELFGRMYKSDCLAYFFKDKVDKTVQAILRSIPFTLMPTLRQTLTNFNEQLEKYNFRDVPIPYKEPNMGDMHMSYADLNCAEILKIFSKMCPDIQPLDQATWLTLFTSGLAMQDSYVRNTSPDYVFDIKQLRNEIRCMFVHDVFNEASLHVYVMFWKMKSISVDFYHRRDLYQFYDYWGSVQKMAARKTLLYWQMQSETSLPDSVDAIR